MIDKVEDVIDNLNAAQLKELEAAMKETDNNEVITRADFMNKLDELKKQSSWSCYIQSCN